MDVFILLELANGASLAAAPTLTTIYIICLIVGGGLLVISTFLGGDADPGFDVDTDVDFDVDADVDAEVSPDMVGHASSGFSLANWFSMQFVVYFFAAFGLVGTALTYTADLSTNATMLWSIVGGLVVGQGAHQLICALRRTSSNSTISRTEFINRVARVSLAINPPKRGEIAVQIRGREQFVPAVAKRDDDRFDVGANVAIVAFNNGTAEVVSQKEHEFVTDSQTGDA